MEGGMPTPLSSAPHTLGSYRQVSQHSQQDSKSQS